MKPMRHNLRYSLVIFGVFLILFSACEEEERTGLPVIETLPVTEITINTAKSGGIITSDGGFPVTARGVVWSNVQDPVLDNNLGFTSDGESSGEFTSDMDNLFPGTTYYLRPYATNDEGTGYGPQVAFETLSLAPGTPGPLFVFGFDDGFDSDFYFAYTELKDRGLKGTSFVHTATIGTSGALTWQMIHEMVNNGWEMGCHTHNHVKLAEATEEEIRGEMEMVNSLYQAQGLPAPRHLTYPNSSNNGFSRGIVSEYRQSGRAATGASKNFNSPDFDFMRYPWVHADMRNLDGQNGLNNAKENVDMAFLEHTVLVSFLIHRVVESTPDGAYECGLNYFLQLVDYIIARGGTIVTQNEAYEIIKAYRSSGLQ
jgi:peptidoglycan/xylan/chitin deacetylase (PgdA/CDA1 family)